MKEVLLVLCLSLLDFGDCSLRCLNDSDSSFNSWLCELKDWTASMKGWKDQIEQYCSSQELGQEWDKLFSCSEPITVTCCNVTMNRCEMNEFNCTACYCADGKYADRTMYRKLWKDFQTGLTAALKLYNENLRYCSRSAKCKGTDSATATTPTSIMTSDRSFTVLMETTMTAMTMFEGPVEGSTALVEPIVNLSEGNVAFVGSSEASNAVIATVETSRDPANETTDSTTAEMAISSVSDRIPISDAVEVGLESMCHGGFPYNGQCFFRLPDDPGPANHSVAGELCRSNGLLFAELLDSGHFNATATYIQGMIQPTRFSEYVWVANTFNDTTEKLQTPTGDVIEPVWSSFGSLPSGGSPKLIRFVGDGMDRYLDFIGTDHSVLCMNSTE